VYAPPGAGFACLEPMTAPTNALVAGDDYPVVAPGESFTARFSIRPERIQPGTT
jgi:galactose mutarotase-like enzyme